MRASERDGPDSAYLAWDILSHCNRVYSLTSLLLFSPSLALCRPEWTVDKMVLIPARSAVRSLQRSLVRAYLFVFPQYVSFFLYFLGLRRTEVRRRFPDQTPRLCERRHGVVGREEEGRRRVG